MQFRNPEVLYFLILLVVPIVVHLFQLQKYKKIAFTNVAFLKKLNQESRKSSRLKRWLILLCRTLLFSGLIFAFSKPFYPGEISMSKGNKSWLYLDNSLSLNANGKRGNLLQIFAQDIIDNIADNSVVNLATNDNIYPNLTKSTLINTLKNIGYSPEKIAFEELELKIKISKSNGFNRILLLSDFQNYKKILFTDVNKSFSLISSTPESKNNISIDSLSIKEQTSTSVVLEIFVRNHGNKKTTLPFGLYIGDQLKNKQSVTIDELSSNSFLFSLEKMPLMLGEIRSEIQDTYLHDNRFYFTLDFRSKTKVLSLGKKTDYFPNIFTSDEFEFQSFEASEIDFNLIQEQQLIILNEIKDITLPLRKVIDKFIENGGTLLIIPPLEPNISSYNEFLNIFNLGKMVTSRTDSLQITDISVDHPIFSGVFTKKVKNYEYPTVFTRWITTLKGNPVLSFSNKTPFMQDIKVGSGQIFWCSAPFGSENSNFTRSPLIVPTLYNLAFQSGKNTKPYYFVGEDFEINIPVKLMKDEVLKTSFFSKEFIPLQKTNFNSVQLKFYEDLQTNGFYAITRGLDTIQQIALNYQALESTHDYLDIETLRDELSNVELKTSVKRLLEAYEEKNSDQELWKLFLAIAIVSLCFEILILKFFKT